jgi:hypothetical protein
VHRRAHLVARVRHGHVVHRGGALEPGEVVVQAEDRRAALGIVGADALEDRGAVVQAVRQDVHARVRPVDQLAVHPDLLGFLHSPVLCDGGAGPPMGPADR